jgi:hypothetical protein
MKNVCKLRCQADYFETPAQENLIHPLQPVFNLKIPS